jgi:hypothetical protein
VLGLVGYRHPAARAAAEAVARPIAADGAGVLASTLAAALVATEPRAFADDDDDDDPFAALEAERDALAAQLCGGARGRLCCVSCSARAAQGAGAHGVCGAARASMRGACMYTCGDSIASLM